MTAPQGPEVSELFQRALALHRSGALGEAEALYRQVLDAAPDHVPALSNRGAALRDLGRPAEALQSYDQALAQRPEHAPTWNNRGVALIDLGREEEAAAAFDRALAIQPNYVDALNNKGRALAALGRPASAHAGRTHDGANQDAEIALASLNRATALNPGYAEAWDNKGLLLFELGRFDEAAEAVEQAILLSPHTVRFHYHLAELRPPAPGDPRFCALDTLAETPGLEIGDQILAHFALGAIHDRHGEAEAAFGHWRRGNALRRPQLAYNEAATLAQMDRIREAFSAGAAPGPGGAAASPTPIFIVGTPRSGSTLVEQILASHPDVLALGETDALRRALRAVGAVAPEASAQMRPQALRELAGEYLRIASPPRRVRAVVDKRLDNGRYAGLILSAMPHARILHVRRDPRDACLSSFSKLFGEELPYAFDLGELGRHRRAHDRLMSHWAEVLPPQAMLEVDYEALVDDLEGQTRRILAHCGLPWRRSCLEFHRTPRRIPTASAVQVRRPLHRDAIGRWRRYEPWLGPLLEALAG